MTKFFAPENSHRFMDRGWSLNLVAAFLGGVGPNAMGELGELGARKTQRGVAVPHSLRLPTEDGFASGGGFVEAADAGGVRRGLD